MGRMFEWLKANFRLRLDETSNHPPPPKKGKSWWFQHVLDSDSDENIGWSRTLDLPRSRYQRKVKKEPKDDEAEAAAAAAAAAEAEKARDGQPPRKRRKLRKRGKVDDEEEEEPKEPPGPKPLQLNGIIAPNIQQLPDRALTTILDYLEIEDRMKIWTTCTTWKRLVESKKIITSDFEIRRLDEGECGLYVAQDQAEARFVIHNKRLTWTPEKRHRTAPQVRRGCVNWTRHHKTRMGRVRTAAKAIFKHSFVLRISVIQVNLSNSFIRDMIRVMNGQGIYSVQMFVQMYEEERPDLHPINALPCKSIWLGFRLKDREPLPHIERFLNVAIHRFAQLVIDVRQDSWKFKSSINYRKAWEEYGITDSTLMHYMTGALCNFLRLKVLSRFLSQDGILAVVQYLRSRDDSLPSRGFCVVVHKETVKNMLSQLVKMPIFGTDVRLDPGDFNYMKYQLYDTTKERFELRDVLQNMEVVKNPPLAEVRYWRKGTDTRDDYFDRRTDNDGVYDPFEQPRFKLLPV